MKIRFLVGLFAVAFLAGSLSACGGGGGGGGGDSGGNDALHGPFTGTAEGFYVGGLVDGTNREAEIVVLENDEFWAFYGRGRTGPLVVEGFFQGSGNSDHRSNFTAADVRDFGTVPPKPGSFAAGYTGTAFVGGFDPGGTPTFLTGVNGTTEPEFPYNTPAVLADITGAWSLTGRDGTASLVTIAATGAIQASGSGCNLTGTIAPRASGKNVFDVSLTLGGAPCSSPGTTLRGVAVSHLVPGTNTRELLVAGVDANRTSGAAFFGAR